MRRIFLTLFASLLLACRTAPAQDLPPAPPPVAPPQVSAILESPGLPRLPLVPTADLEAALARATGENFPDADNVLVADATHVRYEPDGTSIEINEEYYKVLTEKGRRNLRSRSFGFSAHYGRIYVVSAAIIKPDGRRIEIDIAAQSREMTEPSQMGSNIYDPNQKVLQLSLPGVEIGDVTHLAVVHVTSKARVPRTWSDYSVFEYTSPILFLSYEVQAPAELPLSIIRLRGEIENTVTYHEEDRAGGKLHRWLVRNVPQAFAEPNMPPMYSVVQRLLVSTIPDWREISRWYWELSLPRLETTTDEMRAEVERLTQGATTRDEKLRRIFDFVAQRIRYMGITAEDEAPGYEPHDVSLTFANRYGVCRDKAALLVAMLRMADIPAYPVLIHAGVKKDVEVPQPFFNHAIVAAERADAGELGLAERYILMDPTDEKTRDLLPAYLRNRSFLVAHPEGETLLDSGPAPVADNLVSVTTKGTLDAHDTLLIATDIQFDGINDNAYRNHFSRLKPEERRQFFEGLVRARLAGATLNDFRLEPENLDDMSQPLLVHLEAAAPEFPVSGEGAWLIGLPWLGSSVGAANWVIGRTGLLKRRFPLETEPTCGIEETVEIDLGERFATPLALPDDLELASRGLLFEQRLTLEAGLLQGERRFHVRAADFSPEEYLALRDDLKEMEFVARKRIVFHPPASDDDANVHVLAEKIRYELQDGGSWVREHERRLKVLTYAGQKSHSELKFSYNPVWQTVEVLAAEITAPDGTTHQLEERELNEMDAAWVAGAPRYPAEKILVVSLPGVEIGSEVHTRVRSTQIGAPFFSLREAFQGSEPADELTVELVYPTDLAVRIVPPAQKPGIRIVHEKTFADGLVTERWQAAGIPGYKPEDGLPPYWVNRPTLFATTGDWSKYGAALEASLAPAWRDQSAAITKARELVAADAPEEEKIRAVRDFVAQNIQTKGPNFTTLPLDRFSPADVTLRDGYGHTADCAILLLAMLEALDLKAAPLLVGSGAPELESALLPLWQTPQRNLFGTLLVQVQTEHGSLLLNDTDHYAELGTTTNERRPSMTLDGSRGVVEVNDDRRERELDEWLLDVAADGTTRIVNHKTYWGAAVNSFRKQFRELPPEERSRLQQEMVAGISQSAEIERDLITDLENYPGLRRLAVQAPRYAVREGQTMFLTLPGIDSRLLPLRSERRTAPLYLGRSSVSEVRHLVVLPREVTRILAAPPAELNIALPGGLGHVSLVTEIHRLDNGQLEVRLARRVSLDSGIMPPELYASLLAINRRLQHESLRTLVVEIGP